MMRNLICAHVRKDFSIRARGVAMLMVIVVLAGLVALAAPFVFSMLLHQRSARADVEALRAREGAEAATAHALTQLHRKTLRYPNPLAPTNSDPGPEVTTLQDLKIDMDFPGNKELADLRLNVKNPGGALWSARVEDEQGKINVCTAPPALIGNVLASAVLADVADKGASMLRVDNARQFDPAGGIVLLNGEPTPIRYSGVSGSMIALSGSVTMKHSEGELVYDGRARLIADYKFKAAGPGGFKPFRSVYEIKSAAEAAGWPLNADEFARMERHLTVQSGIDGPLWGHSARPLEQAFSGDLRGFTVEHGDGFTPGGLIRVMQAGKALAYQRVKWVSLRNDGLAMVVLEDDIGVNANANGIGNEIYIEPELRNPVNINTATHEVIEACLTGICMAAGHEAVTREQAANLAAYLTAGNAIYTTPRDFGKALDTATQMGILTPQQRDAIYINATEPNSPKLKTTTVTFCFHSFGSYTIEASGSTNSDNGVQLARHTTRQLVSLPTPMPGRFKVEWQAGFQQLLDQGEGSKVVTFPVPISPLKFRKNAPNSRLADMYSGSVRLDVGSSAPQGLPGEYYDSCDDPKDPGYRQDGYDMRKRKAWVLPPVGPVGGPIGNLVGGVACQPGAVEMWYKPIGATQCVFFEQALEDQRNRITFAYQPGEGLSIKIYDAGLECSDAQANFNHLRRNPIEYVYPCQLDSGDWYHIAGSWKTGKPGGQEARVDAQPIPHMDQIKFKPGVRLAQDLGIDDVGQIALEDGASSSDFPKSGAVQIGEEIIEYQQGGGGSLTQLTRGARLSCAAKHSSGEWVMPFGYSVNLGQDLPVGGATLVEDIEKANLTHTNIAHPKGGNAFYLDTEVTEMRVADTSNFPPSGFITVAGELIYYGKKTATAFQQLIRAQRSNTGTPARNIHNGNGVSLASIQITNGNQYDPSGMVQIDDSSNNKLVEWIWYSSNQVVNGKTYLVAAMNGGGPGARVGPTDLYKQDIPNIGLGDFRGGRWPIGMRPNTAHDKKAKVIPVTQMEGPHCGNQLSPYGDQGVSEITVLERGNANGDLRYVKQAYIGMWANWHYTGPNGSCPAKFDSWSLVYYVGLDDFVARRYPARTTRFLKWPSGELPDAIGASRHIGENMNGEGQLRGYVDELKVNTLGSIGGRIAMTTAGTGISASDTDILIEAYNDWPVNGTHNANVNWPLTGGLVRLEDELIYYQSAAQENVNYYSDVYPKLADKASRTWTNVCPPKAVEPHPNIQSKTVLRLSNVTRAALRSKATEHPVGAPAIVYDAMPVTVLTGVLGAESDGFNVQNAAGFPNEGYAWIGNEIVSWQKRNGNSFIGCKPFHARYGTPAEDHESGDIVRCLPFRYWDREAKVYDGTGLAYIQAGYAAKDALWDSIQLRVTGTEENMKPNLVRPRMLVRFDGQPNWDADPTNKEGGLFEFNSREDILPLNGLMGRGVRADQIEMRLYWRYTPGTFNNGLGTEWKRTFAVEMERAIYSTPLIMRRLDEIEKR